MKHLSLVVAGYLMLLEPGSAQQFAGNYSATNQTGPELSALRYFAKQNEFERYRAELQRLSQRYPGFVPPRDIFEETEDNNAELWRLYSEGKLTELETAIEQKKNAKPYWKPDQKLIDSMHSAKQLQQLTQLHEQDNYEGLVEHVLENKHLIINGDPEVIWMVGQALSQSNQTGAAVEAFEFGYTKNPSSSLMPIMIQKAAENLPLADAQSLFDRALFQRNTSKDVLFQSFVRGLVLRTKTRLHDFPSHLRASVDEFGQKSIEDKRHDDVQNIAWAFYSLADYERAGYWFSHVPNTTEYIKAIEGEILSLKHLGKANEALELANQWQETSDEIAALYLNISAPGLLAEKVRKFEPEFLARFALITNRLRSGEGAEALGWYAYNVKQLKAADAWFTKAVEWNLTETAAFGKTLTAARKRNRQLFDTLKEQYAPQYPMVAKLQYRSSGRSIYRPGPSLSAKIAHAFDKGHYSKCIQLFRKLKKSGHVTAHDHQMYGWCLLKLGRSHEAQKAFSLAKLGSTRTGSKKLHTTSLYGAALAALKAGNTAEADRIAKSGQLSTQQYKTVRVEVLAQQALEAFRHAAYQQTIALLNERSRFKREPANLSELRGWSLYKVGQHQDALQVFERLDHVVSSRKTRQAVRIIRKKLYTGPEEN